MTIVPPLRALLESPDLRLDGFIGPGHVSTVVGARPFQFIPADYGKPVVIAGFEPLDILHAIRMILAQLNEGRCQVENQYKRVVPWEGNPRALEVMAEVFELRPHFEWRGLGFISHSGLKLSAAYADYDAEQRFPVTNIRVADPRAYAAVLVAMQMGMFLMADQLSAAIVNARLFEDERQRTRRIATINQIGRLITSSLSLDDIVRTAAPAIAAPPLSV